MLKACMYIFNGIIINFFCPTYIFNTKLNQVQKISIFFLILESKITFSMWGNLSNAINNFCRELSCIIFIKALIFVIKKVVIK